MAITANGVLNGGINWTTGAGTTSGGNGGYSTGTGSGMTTTGTTSTSSAIDPYLQTYFGQAQKAFLQGGNSKWGAPYTGQTVTPMSDQTTAALQGIQGIASQPNVLGNAGTNAITGLLDTSQWQNLYNNAGNDAYAGVVDTQAGHLTDDINRGYSAAGRYGSAAHSGAVAGQVGDFRSKAISDNWNQNVANQSSILSGMGQQQLGALSAIPTVNNQMYAPYDRMASVGASYDDLATRQLQAQKDLWTAQNNQGLTALQAYGGLLGNVGGNGGSTQTVSSPTNYAQIAAGVGGAATGIAGLLSSLGLTGGSTAASAATGYLY